MIQTKDPRDSVNAFLYDANNKTRLIAATHPLNDYKSFEVNLEPNLKSYLFKVVIDTNDEEEEHGQFQLRLSLLPIEKIEALDHCDRKHFPPQQL